MGDVVELFPGKVVHPSDDEVDRSITSELCMDAETNSWLQEFIEAAKDRIAPADMHFMCTNRSLMDRVDEVADEIEAVLPAESRHLLALGSCADARVNVFDMPMREIASELSLSTHVLWLSLSEHYGALVGEYRRRMIEYNQYIEKIRHRS